MKKKKISKIREFLRPTKWKILIFLVIFALAHIPYIGYFYEFSIPHFGISPVPIMIANPIFYPFLSNMKNLGSLINIVTLVVKYGLNLADVYIILSIILMQLIYWYILSSLSFWFYNNLKNLKQTIRGVEYKK